VEITASHNPPHDNGYKVYFSDGAQIVEPHAFGIIREVEAVQEPEVDPHPKHGGKVVILGQEVDAAYPQRWIGKVTVTTLDGRVLSGRVDEPKGDPGNTLSRQEITDKAMRLAAFSGGASTESMRQAVAALWQVASWPRVGTLLKH
jgi:hypothetical protein